mmetsp:Transcript_24052/g.21365  ORF Transcript_24052/g.21365 Transcript_24052/m.21365 type:complete len:123 (+) Transcript_24052:117-485(+)
MKLKDNAMRRSLDIGVIRAKEKKKNNIKYMYSDEKLLRPDTPQKEIFSRKEVLNKFKTIEITTKHPNPTNPHALCNSQKIYKNLKILKEYKRRPPSIGLREVYYYLPQNEHKRRYYPRKFQY